MRTMILLIVCCLAWAIEAGAAVQPATVKIPEHTVWVGQRLQFFVELRAPGSFVGTASFTLPQLPGIVAMKIGSPVVGSEDIDGESWFVQTHEFALFSQKSGMLAVPAFTVRFSHKEGFVGPSREVQADVPGWEVEMKRPPGSDQIGYLITTESLDISENWEPQPGPAQVGAMFKRTIVQQAPQIPGMALVPAPTAAPEGVRVYLGNPVTADRLERGNFLGKRQDTLTYLLREPGEITFPALTYVWWNPVSNTLQSKILPAVSFEVSQVPGARASGTLPDLLALWPYLLALTTTICLGLWQKRCLAGWVWQRWKNLHNPERAAERNLLRACRQDDAHAAGAAWQSWRNYQEAAFKSDPELYVATLELQRQTYGHLPATAWKGNEFARIFKKHLARQQQIRLSTDRSGLPLLNPISKNFTNSMTERPFL
jgi:hypothetical protein